MKKKMFYCLFIVSVIVLFSYSSVITQQKGTIITTNKLLLTRSPGDMGGIIILGGNITGTSLSPGRGVMPYDTSITILDTVHASTTYSWDTTNFGINKGLRWDRLTRTGGLGGVVQGLTWKVTVDLGDSSANDSIVFYGDVLDTTSVTSDNRITFIDTLVTPDSAGTGSAWVDTIITLPNNYFTLDSVKWLNASPYYSGDSIKVFVKPTNVWRYAAVTQLPQAVTLESISNGSFGQLGIQGVFRVATEIAAGDSIKLGDYVRLSTSTAGLFTKWTVTNYDSAAIDIARASSGITMFNSKPDSSRGMFLEYCKNDDGSAIIRTLKALVDFFR